MKITPYTRGRRCEELQKSAVLKSRRAERLVFALIGLAGSSGTASSSVWSSGSFASPVIYSAQSIAV